jgi:arsenite methyltransferase
MRNALTPVYLSGRVASTVVYAWGDHGMSDKQSSELREAVRARYAEAARAVLEPRPGVTAQCVESSQRVESSQFVESSQRVDSSATDSSGGSPAGDSCCAPGSVALDSAGCFGGPLYPEGETDGLPRDAVQASLGCGNPLAVADLHEGERVLDLGSGGGIDVLLSARRVGPSGFAYGVDMTGDMLELARRNAARAGAGNVEFLQGEIEAVPLPEAAVDVVISNCVINLSVDKPAVLAEMFRVLVPGGRIGITDVVAEDQLAPADRAAAGSYAGCIAGALSRAEYLDGLTAAGFADASVTFTSSAGPGVHSAVIRAVKPGR